MRYEVRKTVTTTVANNGDTYILEMGWVIWDMKTNTPCGMYDSKGAAERGIKFITRYVKMWGE